MKALGDEIESMCLASGLCRREVVDATYMAVHPCNRFSTMLSPADVHDLLLWIFNEGYSDGELGVRRAFEKSAGKKGSAQEQANLDLIASSNGLLPRQELQDMRFLSVTSSHTMATVRVVKHGCRVEIVLRHEHVLQIGLCISSEGILLQNSCSCLCVIRCPSHATCLARTEQQNT